MRKMLLAGAVIALGGSTIAAQAQNATPNQPAASAPQTAAPPTRGMMPPGMGGGEMPASMRGDEMPTRMRGGAMFNTRAAILHFRVGELSMTIKCADDESIRVCVTAATALLDKVREKPSAGESSLIGLIPSGKTGNPRFETLEFSVNWTGPEGHGCRRTAPFC